MRTVEAMRVDRSASENRKPFTSWLKEKLKEALALPNTVGELMQKFQQFGIANTDQAENLKEANKLYPAFLARYKTGIQDYKIYAQSYGLPFEGVLKHPTYPNQELRVSDDECLCVYSTIRTDERGLQGDCVEIQGNASGSQVFSVRFGRWRDDVEVQHSFILYSGPENAVRTNVH